MQENEASEESAERLLLLRDSVRRFSDRTIHAKRSRNLRGSLPGYDVQVWKSMAELGWLGVLIPEEYGGLGLECSAMAVIAEELASALVPEPLTPAVVLAGGCLLYGENKELKSTLLPQIIQGVLVPALAWREDGHECNYLKVGTRAEKTKSGVKLYGKKRVVIAGASADGIIVSAIGANGLGLYWLAADSVRGSMTSREMPDGRFMADVDLQGVEVPSENLIAGPDVSGSALGRAFDEALIVTSAELLGVCNAVMDLTMEYLRTRVQFGKAIGSFQALQHRAVDMYIHQRVCRHTLDEVLQLTQQASLAPGVRSAHASRIKARCSESSLLITREAVQMHGAMGYSDECDIGLYLKRAIALAMWLGGAEVHRSRFARVSLNLPSIAKAKSAAES